MLNKGKIYLSKSSPQYVLDAYSVQFQEDFSLFLRSRAEEMVGGGRMVLSFMGRTSSDPTTPESCHQWELLATALMSLVSEVFFFFLNAEKGKRKQEKSSIYYYDLFREMPYN